MKSIHPLSFLLGILSGFIVLILLVGGLHLLGFGQSSGGANSPNLARMAQRFGITQSELQSELSGGKTIQQIAQEHGVQFGGRRNGSSAGTGAIRSGSGAPVSSPSSGAKAVPKSSSPSS